MAVSRCTFTGLKDLCMQLRAYRTTCRSYSTVAKLVAQESKEESSDVGAFTCVVTVFTFPSA